MVAAALILLVWLRRVDAIIAVIIIGREIAISALREWMAKIGKQPERGGVSFLGKVKTGSQMAAILLLLYPRHAVRALDTQTHRHRPDLRRRRADPVVHGLLPADGDALVLGKSSESRARAGSCLDTSGSVPYNCDVRFRAGIAQW